METELILGLSLALVNGVVCLILPSFLSLTIKSARNNAI